jgi:hypothetical protein
MKNVLKYIAIIFVAAVILILALRGCPQTTTEVTIVTPIDTNFAPITKRDYRPKSIPFIENPKKPPIRLPKDIKEKDVKRAIIVTGKNCMDTTTLIETKDGNIFVDKQGGKVATVEEITYKPPILAFGLTPLAGITISPTEGQLISPMIGLSFLTWYGCIECPTLCVDLQGVSSIAFYHIGSFNFGVGSRWNYLLDNRQIIGSVCINF